MNNKKQVVLVMTDTQRKDMLGCYGNEDMQTPNIDSFASKGMRFENAYTCQPLCGPARSALFTGTYPHSNGSYANSIPLGLNVKTVGQRLTDKGVHCAYIGKWHLDGSDYFGLGKAPEGFDKDEWYDMRNYLEEISIDERKVSRNIRSMEEGNIQESFTFGHRCSNRAIEFIQKHKDEDFLLVVSYDEPHDPYICPKPYSEMYKDKPFRKTPNIYDLLDKKPRLQKMWAGESVKEDKDNVDMNNQYFLGCNSYVDYEIGRVLREIDSLDDPMVIYTSDHGDMLNSHCLYSKGPCMYNEITNIPLIISWPSHIKKGIVNEKLASHINITPTIIDFFGEDISKIIEGKSMIPMLENPDIGIDENVFIEYTRYEIDHDGFGGFQPIRCTFDGRYKLSINLLDKDELYDLEKDPYEMNNLIDAPELEDVKIHLHNDILDWMNKTRDPFRGYQWSERSFRKEPRDVSWENGEMTRQREEDEIYEKRQLDYATGLAMEYAVRKK